MDFFICPGMARAGTTFLWRQLTKNETTFNISKDQELRYLARTEVSLDGYLQRFRTQDEAKIFFDVSPIYLFKSPRVLKNLKTLMRKKHRVNFVLNIRSPVDQAYSLYLHQIRGHVSRLGERRSSLVTRDAFESGAINQFIFDCSSHFVRRPLQIVDFVEGIIKRFGRDSLTFIDFNREFGTTSPETKIQNLLGRKIQPFDFSQTTNRGGNQLPTYIYGGESGTKFECGDMLYSVEPGTLVLIGGRDSTRSWPNVEPLHAAQAMNGANLWTTYVPKQRCKELFERHFERDWHRLSELLDYDFLGAVQHRDLVTYRSMPLAFAKRVPGVTVENDF